MRTPLDSRPGRLAGFLVGPIVALALGAAGPAAADPFPHAAHLEEGLECAGCHTRPETGRPAVVRDACADCHDDDVPAFDPLPRRPLRAAFPHERHAASLDCTDCHAATARGTRKPGPAAATPAECFGCHADNGIDVPETRCEACHDGSRKREAPADHAAGWDLRHGRESQWRVFGTHGQDCALCHARNACTECHGSRRPRSHTALWRDRMHGPAASWDRDGCRTCHEPGTCVACHRRTPPSNHRGAWRALHGLAAETRTSEECSACHAPSWCAACHQGAR